MLAALAGVTVAVGLLALAGTGSSAPRPLDGARRTPRAQQASTAAVSHHNQPSPGSLPQTHAYPSSTSPQFRSLMAQLWAGIVASSLTQALPAFFPQGAYLRLKAIAAAGADWSNRLVHDYALDIAAAHALLGPDARRARLLAVDVVPSYGHWVTPGVCANSLGYYEMPNARIVYRLAGHVSSFGIASMISWRGVWYVVHLGAVLRSADAGVVDDPARGAGTSAYSGTC